MSIAPPASVFSSSKDHTRNSGSPRWASPLASLNRSVWSGRRLSKKPAFQAAVLKELFLEPADCRGGIALPWASTRGTSCGSCRNSGSRGQ